MTSRRACWLLALSLWCACLPDRNFSGRDAGRMDASDARSDVFDASADEASAEDTFDVGTIDAGPEAEAKRDATDVGDDALDAPRDVSTPPDLPTCQVDAALPAPRLLAPLSTSIVTSRRPTLRWVSDTADVFLELCPDRGCVFPIRTIPASGGELTPTEDLRPGVVFWRVRGRCGDTPTTSYSFMWEFFVRNRPAVRDSSYGTVPDINGDGLADLLVGGNPGGVTAYLGTADGGISGTTTGSNYPCDGRRCGYSLASAGDLDGDGLPEVVVGNSGTLDRIHLLRWEGRTGRLEEIREVLQIPDAGSFGESVSSAGDFNGDGYADMIVGAAGRAYLIRGNRNLNTLSLDRSISTVTADDPVEITGRSVAGGGDINADGFADVIIGGTHKALICLGNPSADLNAAHCTVLRRRSATDAGSVLRTRNFGFPVAAAGDLNGDGVADFLVSELDFGPSADSGVESQSRTVFVRYGRAGLGEADAGVGSVLDNFDQQIVGPADQCFGKFIAAGGDLNGDGFDDIAISDSCATETDAGTVQELVRVYLGSDGGVSDTPATTLDAGRTVLDNFGASLAMAGDTNGDGRGELVVGAHREDAVYLYHGGSPAGLVDAMSPVRIARPPSVDNFGYSVALRAISPWDPFVGLTIHALRWYRFVHPSQLLVPRGECAAPPADLRARSGCTPDHRRHTAEAG